jgi:hypothetical protein
MVVLQNQSSNNINNSLIEPQYNYLLNNNTINDYLVLNSSTYTAMPKFYNTTIDTNCNSITKNLINSKVKAYNEFNISHIPIVRDDTFKYSVYLETRPSSTFIYSMCFEELFFFDFDDKSFNMNTNNITNLVLNKTKEIIQKMTNYYDSELNIKLFWILYETDNGVHAYCLSHKRNRRMNSHMNNIIEETVKTCADADWAAFVKVRFGYCTRISPKLRYKTGTSMTGGSYLSTPTVTNNNVNVCNTTCKIKKTNEFIDYSKITDVVINLEKSIIIKAPGATILKDLAMQLYIKNSLVILIRDNLCAYCEAIGIPLGMFSMHQCEDIVTNNNTDQSKGICDELKTMADCKISTKCNFKPTLDIDKLKKFMIQIRSFHDGLRFNSIYNIDLIKELFEKSNTDYTTIIFKESTIINKIEYKTIDKNYYTTDYHIEILKFIKKNQLKSNNNVVINTVNNKNNSKKNINTIVNNSVLNTIFTLKNLLYDSNNETILHIILRANIDETIKIKYFNIILNSLTKESDKKKLLNLPGGEPILNDILNNTIQVSYTPIMYLIKYFKNKDIVIKFINDNK